MRSELSERDEKSMKLLAVMENNFTRYSRSTSEVAGGVFYGQEATICYVEFVDMSQVVSTVSEILNKNHITEDGVLIPHLSELAWLFDNKTANRHYIKSVIEQLVYAFQWYTLAYGNHSGIEGDDAIEVLEDMDLHLYSDSGLLLKVMNATYLKDANPFNIPISVIVHLYKISLQKCFPIVHHLFNVQCVFDEEMSSLIPLGWTGSLSQVPTDLFCFVFPSPE